MVIEYKKREGRTPFCFFGAKKKKEGFIFVTVNLFYISFASYLICVNVKQIKVGSSQSIFTLTYVIVNNYQKNHLIVDNQHTYM
jgi:hypothetical protein